VENPPLPHLDTHPKFGEPITLTAQETGPGKERVRAPRLTLAGAKSEAVARSFTTASLSTNGSPIGSLGPVAIT